MSNNHGQKLAGKIAVITGGSSGIGLATAKRFVEEGAHVVITGRREKELKEAAAFIKRNVTTVVAPEFRGCRMGEYKGSTRSDHYPGTDISRGSASRGAQGGREER